MKIQWSHTALKDYENCPRKYHEVRVLKNFKIQKTEKLLYGDRLHAAAEAYAKGQELTEEFANTDLKAILDTLLAKPGVKHPEFKMAVTENLEPCDWFSPDVWVRGIADLLIIDEEKKTAWVVDYKTGNDKYPDRGQLELMSLLVFAHFEDVLQVNAALLFILKSSMVKEKYMRWDTDDAWWKYRERVARIAKAHEAGVWNPQRSGLCGWCEVTTCEMNPKTT